MGLGGCTGRQTFDLILSERTASLRAIRRMWKMCAVVDGDTPVAAMAAKRVVLARS